jgi:non-ribosomal peptide synthase protein (TIGR01720 family)
VALPAKTTSFKAWAERLAAHATSPEVEAELPYWLSPARREVQPLPIDEPLGANTVAVAEKVTLSLAADETALLLQEVPRATQSRIDEVLLAALAMAYWRWAGEPRLLVDVEGHGRGALFEGLDVSRTVGWFTTLHPALLDLSAAGVNDPMTFLLRIKEQLREVPGGGFAYGLLRYLNAAAGESLAELPRAEINFLYLGQLDQVLRPGSPFAPAPESSGSEQSWQTGRSHLLDVRCGVIEGRFQFTLVFSREIHLRGRIERLADELASALRELVESARQGVATAYIPSDFPQADLSQEELDDLLRTLG